MNFLIALLAFLITNPILSQEINISDKNGNKQGKWKKYFNLIKTEKEASRTKVIEIFPYISSKLSKKKDVNKSDAILIARFYCDTRLKDNI